MLTVSCATDPQIGQLIEYDPPARPDIESAGLPLTDNGEPIAMATAGAALVVDETLRDPITAIGACANWVLDCFSPGERTLDTCFRSAPVCGLDQPWLEDEPCCPAQCFDRYREARTRGLAEYPAFDEVLFVDMSCVPGARELVGEEQ
jgi:hypothetical protein